jgi:predicted dehydrogenase
MKAPPMTEKTSRRRFLRGAVAAAATVQIVPRHVLGGPGFVPPSETVAIALVGAGGMGIANARKLFALDDARIVAVADPAESHLKSGNREWQGRRPAIQQIEAHYSQKSPGFRCAEYEDFRVLLEKEKGVDAVLCATPDHLHAYVSVQAMRAGKHLYCEKPLTHNLWETRLVARVARETGVATQMGNQGSAEEGIRETIECLRSGAIGTVREIHSWVSAGRYGADLLGPPEPPQEIPAGLNWDLWLGPREWRDFHPAYHPFSWRDFWSFGNGALGDFGCHELNAPTWAFDLPLPTRVTAHAAGLMNEEIAPPGAIAHFEFPPEGTRPAMRLTWYDGGLKPAVPEALGGFELPRRGALYIGDKGVVQTNGSGTGPRLFPDSLAVSTPKPEASLPRSAGHQRDWLDACKGGPKTVSHFDRASHLTEIVQLGILALRTGKPVEWDGEKLEARGLPEAEPLVRGSYRKGWELE